MDKVVANGNEPRAAAIAGKLNETGFKASRGGAFQAVQVQRIYERICSN
jgi:hypothetical protein